MVHGRTLVDLIVGDNDQVTALGDIETKANGSITLWASRAWEPGRPARFVNGDIALEMRAGVKIPAEASVVLVTGTWSHGVITDARWRLPAELKQAVLPGAPGKLRPSEVSDVVDAFWEGFEAENSDAHISSGGTKDAFWIQVRTMTPSIEQHVSAFPGRVDVFTAVTPTL